MEKDQQLLYLASQLLQYPDSQWKEDVSDLKDLLIEGSHDSDSAVNKEYLQLRDFLIWADALTEEERLQIYIRLFDFGKKTNLYLTYGAYGEERERGPVLLSLKQIYEEAGFEMTDKELSDYLPLVLEFAAVADPVYADRVLELLLPGIQAIHEELTHMETPYLNVTAVIQSAADRIRGSIHDSSSLVKILERSANDLDSTAVPLEG